MKKNSTKLTSICLLLSLIFAGGINSIQAQNTREAITATNGERLHFLEYRPSGYTTEPTNVKHPLIIFLHGIGERGDSAQLFRVESQGIPNLIKNGNFQKVTWNGKTESFIVLSPISPTKYGIWPHEYVSSLIQYASTDLRVDTNRIYLTGLSYGGGGTLRFLSIQQRNARQLAAAAPVCPPYHFNLTAEKRGPEYVATADLPFWGFHATNDTIAKVGATESAVRLINEKNPGIKALATIWPTGNHFVWNRVYNNYNRTGYQDEEGYDGIVNIYEWFLGQNKSLPPNKFPIAKAGVDMTISKTVNTIVLDGGASSDRDANGRIVRYVWKRISGPSNVTISNDFSKADPTTPVSGLTTVGTYKFELNVVDDRASIAKDTMVVTVNDSSTPQNQSPIARAGNDTTITLPTDSVKLNSSASYDPDGNIAGRLWSYVSGPSAYTFPNQYATTPVVRNLDEGVYRFRVQVRDNENAYGWDTVSITVQANPGANVLPVANAGNDTTITLPLDSVKVSSAASYDPDGVIEGRLWTHVSGSSTYTFSNAYVVPPWIRNLVEGTYKFRIQVRDDNDERSWDTVTIHVLPANIPPIANAGPDVTITLPTDSVRVNSNQSSDPNGQIVSRKWTHISGPLSYAYSHQYVYNPLIYNLTEGVYKFELLVRDNDGVATYDTIAITVLPNPVSNLSPIARAGNDVTLTLPTDSVRLYETSTDPDGTIVARTWEYIDGPFSHTIFPNEIAKNPIMKDLEEGVYRFHVKVRDDKGAYAYDTVSITVNAAPNILPVAHAGNDTTITLPLDSVKVNSAASYDPDGAIEGRIWTWVSGPSSYSFQNEYWVSPWIRDLVAGTYKFRIQVRDNHDERSWDTVTITVLSKPSNILPIARAGNDTTIWLPVDSVRLRDWSYDPDGVIGHRKWEKIGGPSSYAFSNEFVYNALFYNLVEGVYILRIRVRDTTTPYTYVYDTMTVTVNPPGNNAVLAEVADDVPKEMGLNVSVHPNPVGDMLNVTLNSSEMGRTTMGIYDARGSLRKMEYAQKQTPVFQKSINISGLASGVYTLYAVVNGKGHTIRFIKK